MMKESLCNWTHIRRYFLCVFIFIFSVLFPSPADAGTIVRGEITNFITDAPLVGVKVEVRHGDVLLGSVRSDHEGGYLVAFDFEKTRTSKSATIHVAHKQYESGSKNFTIVNGKADKKFYPFSLQPNFMSACRSPEDHLIIVGYYRSAVSEQYTDLPYRISEALTFNLSPLLQRKDLPIQLQPFFLACNEAKPRNVSFGIKYAKALKADVFLSGNVKRGDSYYDVKTYVSDRHGQFIPPLRALSKGVNLDDPDSAHLGNETFSAVLAAIASNYEQEQKYAECVDVTNAAEQLLGNLTPVMKEIREKCQSKLENRGLIQ